MSDPTKEPLTPNVRHSLTFLTAGKWLEWLTTHCPHSNTLSISSLNNVTHQQHLQHLFKRWQLHSTAINFMVSASCLPHSTTVPSTSTLDPLTSRSTHVLSSLYIMTSLYSRPLFVDPLPSGDLIFLTLNYTIAQTTDR